MSPQHLFVPGPGHAATRSHGQRPADPMALAAMAPAGWEIDLALVGLAGGSRVAPVLLGSPEPAAWLVAAARSLPLPAPDPLRCFTVRFWRTARPEALPVLALGGRAAYLGGAGGPRERAYRAALWRASALAALSSAAGGPAAIVESLNGGFADAVETSVDVIEEENGDADIERVLGALRGRHDVLPGVVARAALLAALLELSIAASGRAEAVVVSELQVFWAEGDGAFEESASVISPVAFDPTPRRLDVPLPRGRLDRLRLDPTGTPCVLRLEDVRVVVGDRVVAELGGGAELLARARAAGIIAHPADPALLICTNDDPSLAFDLELRPEQHEDAVLELTLSGRRIEAHDHAPPPPVPSPPVPPPTLAWSAPLARVDAAEWDVGTWHASGCAPGEGWCRPDHGDPALLSGPISGLPEALDLHLAVSSEAPVAAMLYVAGRDGVFDERATLRVLLVTDGEEHAYHVVVPPVIGRLGRAQVHQVRLDPVDHQVPFRGLRLTPTTARVHAVPHRPIAEVLAALGDRPVLVSMSHSDYGSAMGGVERRLTDEADAAEARGFGYLHLSPMIHNSTFGDSVDLQVHIRIDGVSLGGRAAGDVAACLPGLDVRAVLVHHLMGWSGPTVRGLLGVGAVPVYVFGHDYFAICPQFTLLRNDRQYCGAPAVGSAGCTVCAFGAARVDVAPRIEALLTEFAERLHIVCPSPTSAALFRRTFAHLSDRVLVSPHQRLRRGPDRTPVALPRRLRLAFAGVATDGKGWRTWRRLCADPRINERYDLLHLGLGGSHDHDRAVVVDFRVSGPDAMRRAIVDEQVDVVVMWATCPETFSFVTAEAITAGALVLTSETSGNAADMVRRHDAGLVLADEPELLTVLTREGELRALVSGRRTQCWTAESVFPQLDELLEGMAGWRRMSTPA